MFISAGDAGLNAEGVDYIRVNGFGTDGYSVNASDGAILNSFSADIDFDVEDTAANIAAEVMAVDTIDFSPLSGISEVDADVQSAISKMYAAGAAGTFDPATGSNEDAFNAGIITATELSKINGLYGSITEAEGEMVEQFITNLPFMGDLDDAHKVVVLSGDAVTVEEAEAIQGISGYTGAGDLDIEDTAAALISAGDTVLNQTGVDHVKASDSSVLASVGAQLNGFTAEIEFDVSDEAANIAANAGNLGEADDVIVVSGGADVTVSQAESIQNLSGYDDALSTFNISDNSAAVISATDSVLTDGNIHVDVTNTVNASDGAILNSYSADIDFTVSDDAADIAAEVMGKSNAATDLDDAEAVIVESGAAVDVDQAAAIQGISGYVGTMSDIDIQMMPLRLSQLVMLF